MPLILKSLLLLSALICFKLSANTPYSIPRSNVVELIEPVSERAYPVYIQLPKSYQKQPNKTYPVIYVTDAPYTFPIVAGATRFPMNSGKMQQAIIVAIGYEKGPLALTAELEITRLPLQKIGKSKQVMPKGIFSFYKVQSSLLLKKTIGPVTYKEPTWGIR